MVGRSWLWLLDIQRAVGSLVGNCLYWQLKGAPIENDPEFTSFKMNPNLNPDIMGAGLYDSNIHRDDLVSWLDQLGCAFDGSSEESAAESRKNIPLNHPTFDSWVISDSPDELFPSNQTELKNETRPGGVVRVLKTLSILSSINTPLDIAMQSSSKNEFTQQKLARKYRSLNKEQCSSADILDHATCAVEHADTNLMSWMQEVSGLPFLL